MSKICSFVLAGLLVSAHALAADTASTTATATASSADLDAQLAAARQKLEAAARDVAQLSSQLGRSAMLRVQSLRTRGVLGLQLQTEPSAKEQGAAVIGVSPGGPAAEAGVATGDVIVAINGDSTTGPNAPREVVEHMANVKPDTKVTLKVMRDGKVKEIQVTPRASFVDFISPLNGQRLEFNWVGPGGPGGGAIFDGMELTDVSPTLGQYFGTNQGVLVVRAPRDGDFLKLQDGDVIQSIDGRVPENGSHASRILRSYQPGEKIHLKVMRQKKVLEVEGTLPDRRHGPRGPRGPRDRGPGPDLPPGDRPPSDQD
ncbi:MAG TPA: PDZ domain-containing protein [Steroidobacteraceae bacterium]|nr:PDZ domain-containing protein [Steroidobacteraceae bacterium]